MHDEMRSERTEKRRESWQDWQWKAKQEESRKKGLHQHQPKQNEEGEKKTQPLLS